LYIKAFMLFGGGDFRVKSEHMSEL